MERRQKYLEEILKKQQRMIFKVSKELELHREFLNLQFESFMDFLFQNGGQIIQLSGKNGQDGTGLFFPLKKDKNGDNANRGGNRDGDDEECAEEAGDDKEGERDDHVNGESKQEDSVESEDILEQLPPPQAILGSPSPDEGSESFQKSNGSRHLNNDSQSNSRRSSQNVVSSTDARNGDDAEFDEVDSSGEYDSSDINGQPEVMKYDMNHFMFSHFLDQMDGGNDEDGMDDSYNDDEMGVYDGEDDNDTGLVGTTRPHPTNRHSQWSNNGNQKSSRNSLPMNTNPVVPPPMPSNTPHNERTCRYCGKTFHWKQSWVIHERTHTGEKPYLCKCGKAFSQKSNMNTHAKSCGQAMTAQKGKTTVFQMKCSHCQKMFTHKKNLDLHMEKFHPEILNLSVKPPSSSSSPTSSQYHNGSGGITEADLSAAAAARAAENAAILQILKTASSQVTSNSATHSVGSLSPSSVNALNHNSNSNGSISDDRTGRYPCPYCPKRFPVKGTLERHLRVHTGEKPFLCGLCGKAFTQKGSVKLHLERVHRQSM